MIRRIAAQAQLVIVDGLRRKTLLGLCLFSLAVISSGIFFAQFISRDIARAANDFLFSVVWGSGFLFLLFYTVPQASWGEERSFLPVYLARPISRSEYVIGLFFGMAALLLAIHCGLGLASWGILHVIRAQVGTVNVPILSLPYFLLAACALYLLHLQLLAVIVLLTSAVRGSFPILLCTLCYYGICNGLPVVRESVQMSAQASGGAGYSSQLLQVLSAFFPDSSRLDFKSLAVTADPVPASGEIGLALVLALLYLFLVVGAACMIYERRDLQ